MKTLYLPSPVERAAAVRVWLEQLLVDRMWSNPPANTNISGQADITLSQVTGFISDAMKAYEHCVCALVPAFLLCTPEYSTGQPVCGTEFWCLAVHSF
jgi:hypothetical protein